MHIKTKSSIESSLPLFCVWLWCPFVLFCLFYVLYFQLIWAFELHFIYENKYWLCFYSFISHMYCAEVHQLNRCAVVTKKWIVVFIRRGVEGLDLHAYVLYEIRFWRLIVNLITIGSLPCWVGNESHTYNTYF